MGASDPWEAERIRRLAEVVRAEREITAATREAYGRLLATIAADVLHGKAPIVAAVPDNQQNRNQIQAAWLVLASAILAPIGALFSRRLFGGVVRRQRAHAAEVAHERAVMARLKNVPNEVYRSLDAVVTEGVRANQSEDEIRASLGRELTPGNTEYDARLDAISDRVGRTEAISAFNAGEEASFAGVAAQGKIPVVKSWLSSHDAKVRATHAAADADPDNQSIPLSHNFNVGGFPALYPGDPTLPPQESVNCRCTVIYGVTQCGIVAVVAGKCQIPPPDPGAPAVFSQGWYDRLSRGEDDHYSAQLNSNLLTQLVQTDEGKRLALAIYKYQADAQGDLAELRKQMSNVLRGKPEDHSLGWSADEVNSFLNFIRSSPQAGDFDLYRGISLQGVTDPAAVLETYKAGAPLKYVMQSFSSSRDTAFDFGVSSRRRTKGVMVIFQLKGDRHAASIEQLGGEDFFHEREWFTGGEFEVVSSEYVEPKSSFAQPFVRVVINQKKVF